jgi:hypothetical protein
MKRATNFWTVQLVTLLLALIILSGSALAANNPGHDSLYIEQSGDSVLTGNLNITYLLTLEGNLYLKSYLDLIANGTAISSSPSRNTIYGTNTLLEIDAASGGNFYLNRYGGTIFTGSPSARTDLNVSGNLYIYNPTGYTTLTVGNVAVCLANGTGCPTIQGGNAGGAGGGWTNTTTVTSTSLDVNVDSGTLFVNSTSNKVGIGTTIPAHALDVMGNASVNQTLYVDTIQITGACCGTAINFNNENMIGLNTITISDGGPSEGIQWADATWSIDHSPLDRSNAGGNLNLYGTQHNIALWRPTLFIFNAGNYTNATPQNGGGIDITTTGSGTGGHITLNPRGNTGISTLTPTSTLQVNGTTNTTYLTIASATAASCDLKADTNGTVYCGTDATGSGGDGTGGWTNTTTTTSTSLNVSVDSGTFFVDSSNNRVGIGTTGPSYPLHVEADAGSNTYTAFIKATRSTANQNNGLLINAGTGSGDTALMVSNKTGEAALFMVTGAGKVGLQTTNPAAYLQVGTGAPGTVTGMTTGPNATFLEIDGNSIAPTAGAPAVRVVANYGGAITTDSKVVALFGRYGGSSTANLTTLYVEASNAGTGGNYPAVFMGGNVGVGDATPDHLLDVAGNIGMTAGSYINWGDTDGSSGYGLRDNSGTIEFKNSAGAWAAIPSSASGGGWTDDGSVVRLSTAADTVAIGTNAVSSGGGYTAKLHLYADYPALVFTSTVGSKKLGIGAGGSGELDFFDTTSDVYSMKMRIQNDGRVGIGSQATNPISLLEVRGNATFNQTLYVTNNGTVGIGTSNPSVSGGYTPKLHLAGQYATLVLEGTTSAKKWGMGVDSLGKLNIFEDASGVTTRILIANGTGNVGIGTTSPSYTLDVNGSINLPTASYYRSEGVALLGLETGTVAIGTSQGYNLTFYTNSAIPRLKITTDGKVGIGTGTSSATSTLQINGTTNTTYLTIASATAASCDLKAFTNGTVYCGTDADTNSGGTVTGTGTGAYIAQFQSVSVINASAIYQNANNIGIGTTTPAAMLDVRGNISLNQTLYVTTNGKVGIGTTQPGNSLHINDSSSTAGRATLMIEASTDNAYLLLQADAAGTNKQANIVKLNTGNLEINNADTSSVDHVVITPDGNVSMNNTLFVKNTGRVGIGHTTPPVRLTVADADQSYWTSRPPYELVQIFRNSSDAVSLALGTRDNLFEIKYNTTGALDQLQLIGGGTINIMSIVNDGVAGRVGINTTSPSQMLHVRGNVQADAYLMNSDERLKKDIEQVSGLAIITSLRGVRFAWNATNTTEIGVIAQDVEKVLPELVVTDENGYKAVKYSNLVGPLIESVKDLNDNDKETEKEMEMMQAEIAALKKEMEMLKQVRK